MLYERLVSELKEQHTEIGDLLLSGSVKDYPSYRYLAGKAQGLQHAINLMEHIIKRGNYE